MLRFDEVELTSLRWLKSQKCYLSISALFVLRCRVIQHKFVKRNSENDKQKNQKIDALIHRSDSSEFNFHQGATTHRSSTRKV